MPPPREDGQVRSKTPLWPGRGFRLVLSHTPAGGDINLASKHQARHKTLETLQLDTAHSWVWAAM